MSTNPPPKPAEQRSRFDDGAGGADTKIHESDPTKMNFDQQGQTGNSKQNTTNQGYQQDR